MIDTNTIPEKVKLLFQGVADYSSANVLSTLFGFKTHSWGTLCQCAYICVFVGIVGRHPLYILKQPKMGRACREQKFGR